MHLPGRVMLAQPEAGEAQAVGFADEVDDGPHVAEVQDGELHSSDLSPRTLLQRRTPGNGRSRESRSRAFRVAAPSVVLSKMHQTSRPAAASA